MEQDQANHDFHAIQMCNYDSSINLLHNSTDSAIN